MGTSFQHSPPVNSLPGSYLFLPLPPASQSLLPLPPARLSSCQQVSPSFYQLVSPSFFCLCHPCFLCQYDSQFLSAGQFFLLLPPASQFLLLLPPKVSSSFFCHQQIAGAMAESDIFGVFCNSYLRSTMTSCRLNNLFLLYLIFYICQQPSKKVFWKFLMCDLEF